MIKKLFFFIYSLILLWLQACVVHKGINSNRDLDNLFGQPIFVNQFTGVLVLNPATGDTIYRKNSQKYFTPASNTKIFTLYACLKLLPDSLPALRYRVQQDTLYIEGTGDPSQLHPYFRDSTVLKYIAPYPNVALCSTNFQEDAWGPGWAWEDYDGYYSAERSALPLYGNVVTLYMQDSLVVKPRYFREQVHPISFVHRRLRAANTFFYDTGRRDTIQIPFLTDSTLTRKLLERAIGRPIHYASNMPEGELRILYSLPSDSVYKRMMQESDNFLAEQLLLTASSMLSDTLEGQRARNFVLEKYLNALPQPPVWVDGSGLSRYNLFSPEDIVYVLQRLFEETDAARLFSFFAAGGRSGTLKDWYAGKEKPYLFAKTGTLANNHCLSGYLKTKKGTILIFSIMNNHFNRPVTDIKAGMQEVLEKLWDTY